jgi:hypothetical protein
VKRTDKNNISGAFLAELACKKLQLQVKYSGEEVF